MRQVIRLKAKNSNSVAKRNTVRRRAVGRPAATDHQKRVKRGRPDDRFQEISTELKRKIIGGKWGPELRIPTRRQLCAKYDASPITVQNIIDQFVDDGFLRSEGRNGTYVVKNPPHMVNVALVFAGDIAYNRYWSAVSTVAKEERTDGLRIIQYLNVKYNGWTDEPDQTALVGDVLRKKLMGIFFTSAPHLVNRTPIVTEPGLPRCALMSPEGFPEMSQISHDGFSFQEKALGYLKSKNRKRIAVIGYSEISKLDWLDKIKKYGFDSGPHWIQGLSIIDTLPGCNLARLLFRGDRNERPDGLVITDDNLVESVTKGIAESGISVPKELDVIAHCNFPCIPPSSVPVVSLGYDAREVLELGISFLRAMKNEGAPPARASVKAVFEDELKTRG